MGKGDEFYAPTFYFCLSVCLPTASIYELITFFRGSQKAFDLLVNAMMSQDLAMKAVLKNAELLVFTSSMLPMRYWSKATYKFFIIRFVDSIFVN